jgi:hypothetical protein
MFFGFRFMNAANASKFVIEQSQIKLHLDMTSKLYFICNKLKYIRVMI